MDSTLPCAQCYQYFRPTSLHKPLPNNSDQRLLCTQCNKGRALEEKVEHNARDLLVEVDKLKGEVAALKYVVEALESRESGGQRYDRVCRGK